MASSQRNTTKFNFGEEGVNDLNENDDKYKNNKNNNDYQDECEEEGDDKPLLITNLSYSTPREYTPQSISRNNNNNNNNKIHHSRNTEKTNSNSLSFSHSHSYSYSHSHSSQCMYPTPEYSVDSLSSPSELNKLKEWLTKHSLKHIYNKLIKAGYDSIDIFAECDDDDIKQIAMDHNLSTPQRLKLRKAIRSLKNGNISNNNNDNNNNDVFEEERKYKKIKKKKNMNGRSDSIIITEKEKLSMMEISVFIENIEECIKIINNKTSDLEEEKKNKEDEICKEFSIMFNILHERRTNLMKELHFIYQQKKDIFEQSLFNLNKMIENTQKSQKQCNKLILSQSVNDYTNNIRNINEIEKNIINITNSCLCNVGPININTKIKVDIKNNDINQIMSVMGDVNIDEECHEELSYDPYNNNNDNDNNNDTTDHLLDDDEDDEELKAMEIDYDNQRMINSLKRRPLHRHQRSLSDQRYDERRKHRKYKSGIPAIRRQKSEDIVGDEWSQCGDNLMIAPQIHSGSNKITNIGKIRNHNNCYKGSGYGSKIVYDGNHYWKLRILCNNDNYNIPYNNFAVGFVAEKYGTNKRNSWFLTHDKSIGIYCDKQIWCNGKKISSNKGILMRNKDIINIRLDMNNGYIYVQRCEYNKNKNKLHDYTVHNVQKINISRNGIDRKQGYRLGCYLRQKAQTITILKYCTNPFTEWC